MKHFWLFSCLLLAVSQASARSIEACPTLPPSSGLIWTHDEGIDFDVCRAGAPGSKDFVLGIYFGYQPDLHLRRANRIGDGKVAGRRVTWYFNDSGANPAFSRQTLLLLDHKRKYVAHVWLDADTEQQLQDLLSALEHLEFKIP